VAVPGGRPGQPLTPGALLPSLRRLGIPAAQARTSALRDLVTQAPAPVIAQALGYSHATTHKHLAHADGSWNKYRRSGAASNRLTGFRR
jgi:hypothetical protein